MSRISVRIRTVRERDDNKNNTQMKIDHLRLLMDTKRHENVSIVLVAECVIQNNLSKNVTILSLETKQQQWKREKIQLQTDRASFFFFF